MCRARARRRLYYIIIIIRTATTTARCSVVPRTRPLRAQTQTAAAAGCAGPAARGSPRRADARTQPPPLPLVPRAVRGYTAFYRRLVSRIGIVLLRYIYIYTPTIREHTTRHDYGAVAITIIIIIIIAGRPSGEVYMLLRTFVVSVGHGRRTHSYGFSLYTECFAEHDHPRYFPSILQRTYKPIRILIFETIV